MPKSKQPDSPNLGLIHSQRIFPAGKEELKELLDSLYDKYNTPDFIAGDPISIPHSFSGKEDREISGFLAATIAWGNRKAIVKSAQRMVEYLDGAPYDFIVNATESDLHRLETYVHRTFNGGDFADFVRALNHFYTIHGGIGDFFESRFARFGDMRMVLSDFRREFWSVDHSTRAEKHLSSIDKKAACKRLNMYVKWMVRDDGRGVDFGIWKSIPASALYLPLDVHTAGMGRALGLITRKQNDWRTVEEITGALREFDPDDPVKYDFALFGAGIDGFLK